MKSNISGFSRDVEGHLRDINSAHEEFLVGLTTADSITHSTRLAVTTNRLIEISPGLVDTTSDSINLDRISAAEIEVDGNQPRLQLSLDEETIVYPLRTEATGFCEKLIEAVNQHSSDRQPDTSTSLDLRHQLQEVLSEAERLFMTGLAAHFQGKQTVPRLRYQQARSKYSDGQEALMDANLDKLEIPIQVENSAPNADPPKRIEDNAVITGELQRTLSEYEITSTEETYHIPENVASHNLSEEARKRMTLLQAWNDGRSFEFRNSSDINYRLHQSEIASELL